MYIWGGKSCLTLVNKFANHFRLFVNASHVKPLPHSVKYVYEI